MKCPYTCAAAAIRKLPYAKAFLQAEPQRHRHALSLAEAHTG